MLVKMQYLAMDGTGLNSFKELTDHDPYSHQIETYDALAKIIYPRSLRERGRACPELVEGVRGKSFILLAPTESGKLILRSSGSVKRI